MVSALCGEVGRGGARQRAAFNSAVDLILERVGAYVSGDTPLERRQKAGLLMASMAGVLMVSRALVDPKSMTSIDDSNFRLAMLGLTVYTASFVCETVRSGVNTVPLGQAEAARSLGFTFGQNLRIVLLPQAFRAVLIPLGSVLIALTKNTTIASAIGVAEAALLMKEMIENTAALLAVGTIFAVGFIVLTLPLGLLFGWLGKRLAVAR